MKNRRKRFCNIIITRTAKRSLNSVSHSFIYRMVKVSLRLLVFVGAVYFLTYTFWGMGSDTIAEGDTEIKSAVSDSAKTNTKAETDSEIDTKNDSAVSVFAVSEAEDVAIDKSDKSEATCDKTFDDTDLQEDDFINPTLGVLTSNFGSRWGRQHHGIDIGGDSGTEIYAALSGSVIFAGTADGYGNYIKLKHDNGYETAYGHCKSLAVKEGQYVEKGQLIAYMGSTGNSTGPHLHFEVKINGEFVNPLEYVVY